MGGPLPINPAGPGEGFSSFNGCSSSMYRAVPKLPRAPGLGMGLGAPLSASISCRVPAGAGFVPVPALRCPRGAVLCAERAGGLGGCSPMPGEGAQAAASIAAPRPRPLRSLPRSRGAAGSGCCPGPARPEGPSGGVSGEGALGGSRVPIADGMKAGAERGCR